MLKWILQKIVGSKNQRVVKRLRPVVAKINQIEEALQQEPLENIHEKVRAWQNHLHRYLPLEVLPTKRDLENMDRERLAEVAASLEARIAPLRDECTGLPASVETTPESTLETTPGTTPRNHQL